LAFDLTKTRSHNQVMLMSQETRIASLEAGNAELRSELEQACQALAEADSAQSLLSTSRDEKEQECTRLHTEVDELKEKKPKL
jgi:predicted nuclease with TOPRIM domain